MSRTPCGGQPISPAQPVVCLMLDQMAVPTKWNSWLVFRGLTVRKYPGNSTPESQDNEMLALGLSSHKHLQIKEKQSIFIIVCLLCSKHSFRMLKIQLWVKSCPPGTYILVDSHLPFQAHFRAICMEWLVKYATLFFLFCAIVRYNLQKLQACMKQASCKSLRSRFLFFFF